MQHLVQAVLLWTALIKLTHLNFSLSSPTSSIMDLNKGSLRSRMMNASNNVSSLLFQGILGSSKQFLERFFDETGNKQVPFSHAILQFKFNESELVMLKKKSFSKMHCQMA